MTPTLASMCRMGCLQPLMMAPGRLGACYDCATCAGKGGKRGAAVASAGRSSSRHCNCSGGHLMVQVAVSFLVTLNSSTGHLMRGGCGLVELCLSYARLVMGGLWMVALEASHVQITHIFYFSLSWLRSTLSAACLQVMACAFACTPSSFAADMRPC